jgi:hypothetical protein
LRGTGTGKHTFRAGGNIKLCYTGIVSYKLDGLESALNTSVITEMTPEQYYEYLEKSKGTISSDLAIKKDEVRFESVRMRNSIWLRL